VTLVSQPLGEDGIPLYLWQASYSPEGTKGLVKEGGTKRRQYIAQLVEKVGGKLHAMYAVRLHATPLLTPEEVDAATKKTVACRPPGA
jgi:hypothetical protein